MKQKWMGIALSLARKGEGKVSPNPMVGALLVKNGKVLARGYHRCFGGPHAEIEVIRRARKKPEVLPSTLPWNPALTSEKLLPAPKPLLKPKSAKSSLQYWIPVLLIQARELKNSKELE